MVNIKTLLRKLLPTSNNKSCFNFSVELPFIDEEYEERLKADKLWKGKNSKRSKLYKKLEFFNLKNTSIFLTEFKESMMEHEKPSSNDTTTDVTDSNDPTFLWIDDSQAEMEIPNDNLKNKLSKLSISKIDM